MSNSGMHCVRSNVDISWLSDGPESGDNGPTGFFWLGGFMSVMTGSKAEALAALAREHNRSCIRFDYSGHGTSKGDFRDCTISNWLDEAVQMFTEHATGPRIIVGSSMGGWLALLLACHLQSKGLIDAKRIKGMVLIAPAADMTQDLMWNHYDSKTQRTIETKGYIEKPTQYGTDPYIITRDLIEDGKKHLILNQPIKTPFPVRILHGEDDPDVPWQHGLKIYQALRGPDITFSLIKSGDHRLSTPRDLATLQQTCLDLCHLADALKPNT